MILKETQVSKKRRKRWGTMEQLELPGQMRQASRGHKEGEKEKV